MDGLIGILILLIPVFAKLIEKKLQKAGNQKGAEKARELGEVFGTDEDEGLKELQEWFKAKASERETESEPVVEFSEPVSTQPIMPQPVVQPVVEQQQPKQKAYQSINVSRHKKNDSVILNEEVGKPKEKIDPKKLVIYSEIMKPKF